MTDITALEDKPAGKKSHFIIHFSPLQMHLKSDDQAVKDKWFNALTLLWNHYKNDKSRDVSDEIEEGGTSSFSPSKSGNVDSPTHYKTKKINPAFLLEIIVSQQRI